MLTNRPFNRKPMPERKPMAWPGVQSFAASPRADMGNPITAQPKEAVARSPTYEAYVRKLACRRCGIVGFSQFCHMDEGKGMAIKTDVRQGWAGCGPREGIPGCHWFVGTSGTLPREIKRSMEADYAASTREEILKNGNWPKNLPRFNK